MMRMIIYASIGAVVGFLVLLVIFRVATRMMPDERMVLTTFGSLIVAVIGALLGAVSVIQTEIRNLRREMERSRAIDLPNEPYADSSTHIKSTSPRD